MVKPTFLCIGVQKAGTTSLIAYLSQHPDIFMKSGESHFFDTMEPTPFAIRKYENTFCTRKRIVGEKTPSYNYLRYAMDRIYTYNPHIKLVLILREPIARAFSQYNMNLTCRNKRLQEKEMLTAFEKEEHVQLSDIRCNGNYYIVRGKYDEIISYILSKFPRENLYIGIAEEIRANKQTYYNDIIQFLGADTLQNIDEHVDTRIGTYRISIPDILEKKLYNIYKPHNERLYAILGRRIDIWEKYYDTIRESL